MTDSRSLAAVVHEAIDDVTTAVESIHQAVAEFPLTVLAEITPFKETLDDVRATQQEAIEAAYGLVRTINHQVQRVTTQLVG
jgi:uncharacterized NAD-dependent epimerase/dehydratase family protein